MFDGSIYGIKVKVEMTHHKTKEKYDAKVRCPECDKPYTSFNNRAWTVAKNSALDNLRTHYNSRHK